MKAGDGVLVPEVGTASAQVALASGYGGEAAMDDLYIEGLSIRRGFASEFIELLEVGGVWRLHVRSKLCGSRWVVDWAGSLVGVLLIGGLVASFRLIGMAVLYCCGGRVAVSGPNLNVRSLLDAIRHDKIR